MKATFAEVIAAIEGERAYQEMRVVRDGSTAVGPDHFHSPEEYLLYMEHYMHLAREKASTVWGPDAKTAVLDILRKVVTLGVACMEQNGVVHRAGYSAGVEIERVAP